MRNDTDKTQEKAWRVEMKQRLMALGMTLVLALGVTGCRYGISDGLAGGAGEFDAQVYVDGFIRQNYLGEYDRDYLELVGVTAQEAEQVYRDSIDNEVSFFISYLYDIEYPTDEYVEQLRELYKEIYSHTKYTIVSVDELSDGSFAVKVEVEPIDIVQQVESDWDKNMKEFYETYSAEVVNAMDDEEYEAFDKAWAEKLLELYKNKMPEIGNMTPRSVVVQIQPGENGEYRVETESFRKLDDLIIDYTDSAGVMS